MRRLHLHVLLAALVLAHEAFGQDLTLAMPDSDWAKALRRSNFAFYARVLSVNSTSTASVKAGNRTSVVETIVLPDSATRRPSGFRPLGVRRVTVVTRDTVRPAPGTELYLFTAGLASDSGLAVRELARAQISRSELPLLVAKLAAAHRAVADAELAATLKAARAVWLARVDSMHQLPPAGGPRAEQSTRITEAFLSVRQSLAGGRLIGGKVRVLVLRSGTSDLQPLSLTPGAVAVFAPFRPDARWSRHPAIARAPFVILFSDQVLPASDTLRVARFLP